MAQVVRTARYMARFTCLGGECEDTCCGGWTVPLEETRHRRLLVLAETEPAAQKLLDEGIELTPAGPDFAQLKFNEAGYCAMLEPNGLCAIHRTLGPEALPEVCMTYPRYYNHVDGELELFGTISCPEVARLCLFDETAHQLEAIETEHAPGKLRNQFRTVTPYYRPYTMVRESLVTLLSSGGTLDERLFAMLWLANQLSPVLHRDCDAVPLQELKQAFDSLAKPEVFGALAQNYRGLRLDGSFALHVLDRALAPESPEPELGQLWSSYQELRARVPASAASRVNLCLTRYAVNYVFTTPYMLYENLLAFASDLAVRVATLRFLLVRALADFNGSAEELDACIVDVAYKFGRRVEHAGLIDRVGKLLDEQKMRTFAHAVCFVAL